MVTARLCYLLLRVFKYVKKMATSEAAVTNNPISQLLYTLINYLIHTSLLHSLKHSIILHHTFEY